MGDPVQRAVQCRPRNALAAVLPVDVDADMTSPLWGEVDQLPGATGIDNGTSRYVQCPIMSNIPCAGGLWR